MKKTMCFGTFDVVHKGHEYFLKKAKKMGDYLVVVVALDETVESVKKRKPKYSASERAEHVKALGIADKIILGSREDKLKVILDEKPDVICLGYDQDSFTETLEEQLKKKRLTPDIVRLKAFKPEVYKSSIIKKSTKKTTNNSSDSDNKNRPAASG